MNDIPDGVIKAMERAGMDHWGYLDDGGMQRAIAAAEALGYKLVPREPTPAMVDAHASRSRSSNAGTTHLEDEAINAARALWDAAPSAKEGK